MESVSVLLTAESIEKRVCELAAEIDRDYGGKVITLLGALKGAVVFMSDLARKLTSGVEFDFIKVSSYGDSTESSGDVALMKKPDMNIGGRHILLVEDIVDTGYTLEFLRKYILAQNPASFKVCSLLDKPDRRKVGGGPLFDYLGFAIPDKFVVGYGLDYAQRYRNLPYVGVLDIE